MDSEFPTTTRFLSGAAVAASLAASKSAADITSELISSQPVRGLKEDKEGPSKLPKNDQTISNMFAALLCEFLFMGMVRKARWYKMEAPVNE